MVIGVCRIWVRLPENHSLKGKRQAVRSISAAVRNRFDVAVAEVGDLDSWQIASLGISCVSNSAARADEVLSKVVRFVEVLRMDAEVVDYRTEILHVLTEDLHDS